MCRIRRIKGIKIRAATPAKGQKERCWTYMGEFGTKGPSDLNALKILEHKHTTTLPIAQYPTLNIHFLLGSISPDWSGSVDNWPFLRLSRRGVRREGRYLSTASRWIVSIGKSFQGNRDEIKGSSSSYIPFEFEDPSARIQMLRNVKRGTAWIF